jgi:hypothetical protein
MVPSSDHVMSDTSPARQPLLKNSEVDFDPSDGDHEVVLQEVIGGELEDKSVGKSALGRGMVFQSTVAVSCDSGHAADI